MEKEKLSVLEKDILTEIGSMCAGNATVALAQILGRRIELQLPSVKVVNVSKLSSLLGNHPEEVVVGIYMQILGGMQGSALLVFPKGNAFVLIDLLIGPLEVTPCSLTEIGISALKEMGNIIISAYLSALSAFAGISSFSSTVTLTSGAIKSLINLTFSGLKKTETTETILIEAVFSEKKRDLAGNFFIIFDAASMKMILRKAKGMIKQRK